VDPIAFKLGSLTVHWYGVLIVCGFVSGLWLASRRCLRDGLSPEAVADGGVWILAGAIIGARVFHVVAYWESDFAHKPWWEVVAIWHGGLVYYGGLVGASLATALYVRKCNLPLWKFADALAPSIALGQFFGRIGCFLQGCCYGLPTSLACGVRFPQGTTGHSGPVHPTQLYEAALNLGLYGALAWHYRRKRFAGETFAWYLIGYAVLRFAVEFFRGDYPQRYLGWATPGQLTSVLVLATGLILWWRGSGRSAGASGLPSK
jgi:phosphatidylglycerol:prolipoprotein diacylglycerol transferase